MRLSGIRYNCRRMRAASATTRPSMTPAFKSSIRCSIVPRISMQCQVGHKVRTAASLRVLDVPIRTVGKRSLKRELQNCIWEPNGVLQFSLKTSASEGSTPRVRAMSFKPLGSGSGRSLRSEWRCDNRLVITRRRFLV